MVLDEDKFFSELIRDFINKTEGVSNLLASQIKEADIVFVDVDLFDGDYKTFLKPEAQIIIVSSDKKHINAFFKKETAGFIYKPDLNYTSFLSTVTSIQGKLQNPN